MAHSAPRRKRHGTRFGRLGRNGFTLVELLVVIAIIGILVSLLLPAVQAAREAARRMQCQNNLKQIGLAIHNYNDVYHYVPPGWIVQTNDNHWGTGTADNQIESWGWGSYLLPFVEQANLYDQMGVGAGQKLENILSTGLQNTVLTVYRCPSDAGPDVYGTSVVRTGGNAATKWAASSYKGNFGHCFGVLEINPTTPARGMMHKVGYPGKLDLSVRFRQVSDGLSNTIAVGETCWKRGTIIQGGGVWAGTARGVGGNGQHDLVASGSAPINPGIAYSASSLGRSFGSNHSGGAQFVLSDGSVHFISETIDYKSDGETNRSNPDSTYEQLLCRDDGLPVGPF